MAGESDKKADDKWLLMRLKKVHDGFVPEPAMFWFRNQEVLLVSFQNLPLKVSQGTADHTGLSCTFNSYDFFPTPLLNT